MLERTRLPALTVYYCYDDERLFDIARRYHTTVDAVKKVNGTDGDTVLKGSVILVPWGFNRKRSITQRKLEILTCGPRLMHSF